jgi:hypothetical protein
MPDGRFYSAEVKGMVFGADSTKTGVIYFAKTRCMRGRTQAGNGEDLVGAPDDADDDDSEPLSNAWAHYFKGVFTRDILSYRAGYNDINPETNELSEDTCTIDGENCVNRELLDTSVWQGLERDKIRIVKNRASGTAKDNANDASDNFRDKNTGLKMIQRNNIDTSNPFLEQNLEEVWTALKRAFPQVKMTSAHWRKVVTAICRFVYVCRSKYVTSQKGIVGFQRACQVRVPGTDLVKSVLGHENSTVDSYRMLKHLCYTKISDGDMDNIFQHFPEMIAIQEREGRVDNVVMDRLQICNIPPGEFKDRDALCLAQQGPVELTHAETRNRQVAFAARKETAIRQKAMDDALALIANDTEKRRKASVAKAEKERVSMLTAEQKELDPFCIAEKAAVKERNDKAKAAKLAKDGALQAAMDLVSAVNNG